MPTPPRPPAFAIGLLHWPTTTHPAAAELDLKNLRRDVHDLLDITKRSHPGWRTLNGIRTRARDLLHSQVTGPDGRSVKLDRTVAAAELRHAVASAEAVVVSGASGVGKSALAVLDFRRKIPASG